MRLIDADALMDDINRAINAMTAIGIVVDGDWLWAKLNDALDNAPTIEPEKRTEKRAETHACDCISRQAVIDALIRKIRPHNNGDGTITMCVMSEELVEKTLNDLPSAQPERKTGRWIHKGGGSFICSDCGEMVGLNTYRSERAGEIFRYCPHCGAYMGGEEDGSD